MDLDPGPWTLDPGPWTLDPGPWTLDLDLDLDLVLDLDPRDSPLHTPLLNVSDCWTNPRYLRALYCVQVALDMLAVHFTVFCSTVVVQPWVLKMRYLPHDTWVSSTSRRQPHASLFLCSHTRPRLPGTSSEPSTDLMPVMSRVKPHVFTGN